MSANFRPPEDIDVWDAENVFYLKTHPSRLGKLLAHYEIYKRILSIPGAIVECGVYKGASLSRFASFRAFLENNHSRKIYGFDAFGDFPKAGVKSTADKEFIKKFESAGGAGISIEDLSHVLQTREHSNVELIKGDVFATIPRILKREPQLRVALLHLDMDVYEPTKFAIDEFLPHMVTGGLIVFDDYNSVEGATRAADEFCRKHGFVLEKLPFYNVPAFAKVI